MPNNVNIRVQLPEASRPDRYFTIRLHPKTQERSSIYSLAPSLFVVSDLNGKFRSFYKLLINHKIIDKHLVWTFGDGQLVILGNYYEEKELLSEYLWFIYSLEQKAKSKGGSVHFIPGSHEIIQINGKWTTKHPSYAPPSAQIPGPVTALYNANLELRKWLGTRNIVEKIGDFLFIHGANLPILFAEDNDLFEINKSVRLHYNNPELSKSKLLGVNIANFGITENSVISTLMKLNAQKLVTVYKTKELGISSFGGKLINLNNLQSNEYLQGLLIKKGHFIQANIKGTKEIITI